MPRMPRLKTFLLPPIPLRLGRLALLLRPDKLILEVRKATLFLLLAVFWLVFVVGFGEDGGVVVRAGGAGSSGRWADGR